MSELVPCPKCRTKPTIDQMANTERMNQFGLRFERHCPVCDWSFGTAETVAEADALWNNAGQSVNADLLEALKPFARIAEMEIHADSGTSVIVNIDRCRDAKDAISLAEKSQ
jgi:transcriptional regulator NrdR family protein